MDSSGIARILLIISGILTLIGAGIALILSIISFIMPFLSRGEDGAFAVLFFAGIGFIITIVVFISAMLKFWAAKLVVDPERATLGGTIALIIGVLNSFDLLSIIAGILVFADSDAKSSKKGNSKSPQRKTSKRGDSDWIMGGI